MSGDIERHVLIREDGIPAIVRRGQRKCPSCGKLWASSNLAPGAAKPTCPMFECAGAELGELVPIGSQL